MYEGLVTRDKANGCILFETKLNTLELKVVIDGKNSRTAKQI